MNKKFVNPRSIPLCIVFSIITCGIYTWYWIYKINEEVNSITDNTHDTSGGLVVLFSILTCGIYTIYWGYKIGYKLSDYYRTNNLPGDKELSILFLILLVANYIAVGICWMVAYGIMQDNINTIVEYEE